MSKPIQPLTCWISFCHEIYWSSFAAGDFDSCGDYWGSKQASASKTVWITWSKKCHHVRKKKKNATTSSSYLASFLAICFVCFGIYDVNDFSDDFDCGFWKQHASMPLHRALGFCQSYNDVLRTAWRAQESIPHILEARSWSLWRNNSVNIDEQNSVSIALHPILSQITFNLKSWSACFSLEICFHFFCAFAHHQPLKLSLVEMFMGFQLSNHKLAIYYLYINFKAQSMAQLHAAGSLFLIVGVLLGRNRLSYHFWRQLFEVPGSRKHPFKPMEPTSLSGFQSSRFTASWLHTDISCFFQNTSWLLNIYAVYALDSFLRMQKSQIAAGEGSLLCTFWESSTTPRPDCHSLKRQWPKRGANVANALQEAITVRIIHNKWV